MEPEHGAQRQRRSRWRQLLRWLLRLLIAFALFAAIYFLLVWILGAIAVNNSWRQATTGVEIMVSSNGVHTDFYLPTRTAQKDWAAFAPLQTMGLRGNASYVVIGWGDRGFFLDTPTWEDLTVGTAINAVLLPSATVMHIYYRYGMPVADEQHRKIRLSDDEYAKLVAHIEKSFRRDASGRPVLIPDRSYSSSDVFYEGVGSYHLFDTCNNWACRALDAAGVTVPLWSPFDGPIFAHLRGK